MVSLLWLITLTGNIDSKVVLYCQNLLLFLRRVAVCCTKKGAWHLFKTCKSQVTARLLLYRSRTWRVCTIKPHTSLYFMLQQSLQHQHSAPAIARLACKYSSWSCECKIEALPGFSWHVTLSLTSSAQQNFWPNTFGQDRPIYPAHTCLYYPLAFPTSIVFQLFWQCRTAALPIHASYTASWAAGKLKIKYRLPTSLCRVVITWLLHPELNSI